MMATIKNPVIIKVKKTIYGVDSDMLCSNCRKPQPVMLIDRYHSNGEDVRRYVCCCGAEIESVSVRC